MIEGRDGLKEGFASACNFIYGGLAWLDGISWTVLYIIRLHCMKLLVDIYLCFRFSSSFPLLTLYSFYFMMAAIIIFCSLLAFVRLFFTPKEFSGPSSTVVGRVGLHLCAALVRSWE